MEPKSLGAPDSPATRAGEAEDDGPRSRESNERISRVRPPRVGENVRLLLGRCTRGTKDFRNSARTLLRVPIPIVKQDFEITADGMI